MAYALDLAKYIVTKCVNDKHAISNLQLQKILYFIQVDSYKRYNKPAFKDDFEAWQFGPVIPDVYYYFCSFGGMPIWNTYSYEEVPADEENINRIVEEKRALRAWDLVEQTHRVGGAWAKTYNDGDGNRKIIPKPEIRVDNSCL